MKNDEYKKIYEEIMEDKFLELYSKLKGISVNNSTELELTDEFIASTILGCSIKDDELINEVCNLVNKYETDTYIVTYLWGVLPFISEDVEENDLAKIYFIVKKDYWKKYMYQLSDVFNDSEEITLAGESLDEFIKYNERTWDRFSTGSKDYFVFSYRRGNVKPIEGLIKKDICNDSTNKGISYLVCMNEEFNYVNEFINDILLYQLSKSDFASIDEINWIKDAFLGKGRIR